MRMLLAGALGALAMGGSAHAAIAEQWDTGFTTKNAVTVRATRAQAYAALGEVGRWWNIEHSYGRDGTKLTLAMKPGGCFCEALPGGGVEHGRVLMAWPEQGTLRLSAALGPLQDMGVTGVLTFEIKPKGEGAVEVTQTYTVSGGRPGFAKPIAAPVDGVVSEQLRRYASYVEAKRVEQKPAVQDKKVPPPDPRARLRRNERS